MRDSFTYRSRYADLLRKFSNSDGRFFFSSFSASEDRALTLGAEPTIESAEVRLIELEENLEPEIEPESAIEILTAASNTEQKNSTP